MENKEWKSSKQILNELKEENSELKKQTTSQKQTIERLRESLREVTDSLKLVTNGGGHPESKCKMKIDKAEQLLNTTEPIEKPVSLVDTIRTMKNLLDRYLMFCSPALRETEAELNKETKEFLGSLEGVSEDELLEEMTHRNAVVVSDFMEHCKGKGFIIPDSWFESYFNA